MKHVAVLPAFNYLLAVEFSLVNRLVLTSELRLTTMLGHCWMFTFYNYLNVLLSKLQLSVQAILVVRRRASLVLHHRRIDFPAESWPLNDRYFFTGSLTLGGESTLSSAHCRVTRCLSYRIRTAEIFCSHSWRPAP
ncbi:hypothetical protein J6590_030224 [Homalodisca vitripennis]|nr:hypothetical protein J6590_030224 [Homalodisca vitripennis]